MISKPLLLSLLFLVSIARADEQVRAVQEELRRRNVYFGDIDGQRTPELDKATQRYQKRKGFATNGNDDRDTLRSLGLLPRDANEAPPKELQWPAEPVLKSDAKIDIVAEAKEISAETGVAAESIAPEMTKATARKTAVESTGTPLTSPSQNRSVSARDPRLEGAELSHFILSYMQAVSHNDVRKELEFYGDHVSYYDNGQVDRRIIENSLKRYYRRWPSRHYQVMPKFTVERSSQRGEIVLSILVDFTLKSKGQVVRGRTQNRLTINAGTADPRIVAIEEHRVRL